MAKLMKKQRRVPRVMVTDKLRSYGVAHRDLMRSVEHRQSKYLNNRAENSHQPTRQRERAMKGFRSANGAQQFLSVFSAISPHFRSRRHRLTAHDYRAEMHHRFTTWNQVTGGTGLPPQPENRAETRPQHARPDVASPRHAPDKLTTPPAGLRAHTQR
jgi:putative transposase